MNYEIRECTIEDADSIYKLNHEEMGYDYPVEETRLKLQQLLDRKEDKVLHYGNRSFNKCLENGDWKSAIIHS